jgi:tetratricopeptide (TPR) repeat protein
MHFETDAISKPHLIKTAWHPRWKLRSAGEIYIAGPGFMLVVPQERDIILEYGHTKIGYAGMAATVVSFAVILFLLIRRGKYRNSPHPPPNLPLEGRGTKVSLPPLQGEGRGGDGVTKHLPVLLSWTAIALTCLWFATQSPEKVYMRGHAALQNGHNAEAAELFQRAFNRRRQPAKKEEALFWCAKATQLAGNKEDALKRYLQLVESYHGYWVPESLYACVVLGRDLGQSAKVESCVARLKEEYPNSSWTGKLGELK